MTTYELKVLLNMALRMKYARNIIIVGETINKTKPVRIVHVKHKSL